MRLFLTIAVLDVVGSIGLLLYQTPTIKRRVTAALDRWRLLWAAVDRTPDEASTPLHRALYWNAVIWSYVSAPVWVPMLLTAGFVQAQLEHYKQRRDARRRAALYVSEQQYCIVCGNRSGKLTSIAEERARQVMLRYTCSICGAQQVMPSVTEVATGTPPAALPAEWTQRYNHVDIDAAHSDR